MALLKKYWKRFNRGLIIALIIVLIIAVHTIVTNRRFKRDKKDVKKTAETFIDGLGDLKLFKCEGKLDDKARQEAVDEAMEYLDKYMTDETLKNTNYETRGYRSKEDYEKIIKNLADVNAKDGAYIKELDYKVEHNDEESLFNSNISRFGSRGIKVSVSYQYSVCWDGKDDTLDIFAARVHDDSNNYYGYDEEYDEEYEDEQKFDGQNEDGQNEDGQNEDRHNEDRQSVDGQKNSVQDEDGNNVDVQYSEAKSGDSPMMIGQKEEDVVVENVKENKFEYDRMGSGYDTIELYFIYTDGEWKISALTGSYSRW